MGHVAMVAACTLALWAWRLRSRQARIEEARDRAIADRDEARRALEASIVAGEAIDRGARALRQELDDLQAALARGDLCSPDDLARRLGILLSEGPIRPGAPPAASGGVSPSSPTDPRPR